MTFCLLILLCTGQPVAPAGDVPVRLLAKENDEAGQATTKSSTWPVQLHAAGFANRTVGGRLLHVAMGSAEKESQLALVVHQEPNGIAWVGLESLATKEVFAGVNAKGISVSAVPTQAQSLTPTIRKILREADTLTKAQFLADSSNASDVFSIIVGDGKAPDARVIERGSGKGTDVFGPNDAAEKLEPFFPLVGFVSRGKHLVSRRNVPGGEPERDEAWLALKKVVLAAKNPLTLKELLTFESPSKSDLSFCAVFDASEQQVYLKTIGTDCYRVDLRSIAKDQASPGNSVEKLDLTTEDPVPALTKHHVKAITRGYEEPAIPERYRIDSSEFDYELEPERVLAGICRSKLRFPSPMVTPYPENNVVHTEYFRPMGKGPFPCVICLHIAGGDFDLSRMVANNIAQKGVSCIFVKMPFYGERQPPGKKIRMLEPDAKIASMAMTQVILDLRRLCDLIQTIPDLDGQKIGIQGISLGSITGSLACAIEPRISHACLIMGGGKLGDLIYGSVEPEARAYRKLWEANGGTKESLQEIMAPFDATSYPERLRERVVFMICASQDESVPVACGEALWQATGKQKIVWYPAGHYTMIKYIMPALGQAIKFYQAWPTKSSWPAGDDAKIIHSAAGLPISR